MKRALFLAAVIAAPAAAATATLTVQAGQWQRIYSLDTERAIGRSIRIDTASIAAGGLGRQFRQANVLLRQQGNFPAGTIVYARRSVNCQAGTKLTYAWSATSPAGVTLGAQTYASPATQTVRWSSQDGKVLRFVCRGILPR